LVKHFESICATFGDGPRLVWAEENGWGYREDLKSEKEHISSCEERSKIYSRELEAN
jgi:hypothetical protein